MNLGDLHDRDRRDKLSLNVVLVCALIALVLLFFLLTDPSCAGML